MTYGPWLQIYGPPRTHRDTKAANEGVTKAIASFCRDDSDTVYLGLSYDLVVVPILYLPTLSQMS